MENTAVQMPDYGNEIAAIIRGNASPRKMYDELKDYHENDIAEVLPLLSITDRRKLYRILNVEMMSDILEYVDEEDVGTYISEMDVRKAVSIVSHMEADSAVETLRSIPKERRLLLIDLMDESVKKDIVLIASFDEEEIGSKMSTNYIVISDKLSVKQAMASLIDQAARNDNISTLFVVDEDNEFYGALDLKDLIIAREGMLLDDLIVTSYPYVYGNESVDDCIEKLKDYSENSIPVLNNENQLLGVITSQSIIEVVDEEMGEDYAKLAGLAAEEDLKEPLKESMKKRLPWLTVLLCLGMIVSTVVGLFESVVVALPLIIGFQSLVLGMSGNVGTQSLAVTIRVLMDENLTGKQKLMLVGKEVRTGFSNGLILGILAFLILGVFILVVKGQPAFSAFAISGCIGLSLLIAMTISSAVGTLIPIFFKRIGIDPAVASGPFITTVNDLVAVICYYGLSWLLLLNVLNIA